MIFHMPNKHITLPILQISNTNIEKVNDFNFLGLTIDTRLDWKRHSSNISNNISRTIGVLNKLKKCIATIHENYYIQHTYTTTFKLLVRAFHWQYGDILLAIYIFSLLCTVSEK